MILKPNIKEMMGIKMQQKQVALLDSWEYLFQSVPMNWSRKLTDISNVINKFLSLQLINAILNALRLIIVLKDVGNSFSIL